MPLEGAPEGLGNGRNSQAYLLFFLGGIIWITLLI